MTNSFKELQTKAEASEALKTRVMQSVNLASAIYEIIELFTINYVSTIGKLFSTETGIEEAGKD